MAIKPVSPLNLDRYELKYIIPFRMVEVISDYVAQYCELDYYSQISPDKFYVINSLYLDTPTYYIARSRQNAENELSSFRIRSYGSDPKPPFYVESKMKLRDFCRKRRGKIPIDNLQELFDNPWALAEKGYDPFAEKNVADFLAKVSIFGLEPKILTQYRRKAYLSQYDDYARVTFDRDMRYMEQTEYNVCPDEKRMTHYDLPEAFDWPESGRNVVLELKCERKIPIWMVQLIRGFELERHKFSKFKNSVFEMQGTDTARLTFDLSNTQNALLRKTGN